MKEKKVYVFFVIGLLLLGLAGYFYYSEFPYGNMKEKDDSNNVITTEEGNIAKVTENKISENATTTTEPVSDDNVTTTTEQKKELPKDYVWDTERLGEPPQIIYDFADNQERFDYIVEKVDSIISEDDGFSTGIENNKIYYDSGYNNLQEITTNKFQKNIMFLFKNTKFYEFTKDRSGYWIMHYNQEENRERFIFIMAYIPGMTDEQAYEEGYYRVVGDWFFGTIWKI